MSRPQPAVAILKTAIFARDSSLKELLLDKTVLVKVLYGNILLSR